MNETTFQGNGKVTYVPVVVDGKPHKQTRADRIRGMTDEELAEWFIKIQNDHVFAPDFPTMKNSWLDWLKQEVET